MAFFESNTVLTPEQVRSTIASIDEDYANTLPQLPTVGEGATRAEFMRGMTGPARTKELIESVESGIPVSSVGRDASRKEFMAAMMAPETAIANAIKEDGDKTKESDVQDKEQIEAVEAFTSGSTSLPVVVGKEKKKVDLFAGARRAEELLASMSGPERAADLVESIEKNKSVPKASVDVGGIMDLIQPKKGSLDVAKADLSPASKGRGISSVDDIPPQYRRMMQDVYMERHGVPMPDDILIESYLRGDNTYRPPPDNRSFIQKLQETPQDARERYRREVEEDPLALSGKQQKRIEQGDDAVEAVKKQLEEESKATTATAKTDQQLTDQAASGARATSSGNMYDLMREIAGTREQAKKEAFANAMIQLGAGVASGNLAAGLSAAGKAASETMSDYKDRALKGRLAELQLKKADIQEARYARSEDLAERREKRYLIAAANESIKEQTDNLLVKVGMELEAKLGRTPTDAEIANAMEDARQRIIDAAATTYGLDRRLLGGVSVTPEEEDDDAPTTQYQTDPSAPKLVDVN